MPFLFSNKKRPKTWLPCDDNMNYKLIRESLKDESATELNNTYNKLVVAKMKMDKFFSVFLSNSNMDERDTDTDEWKTYKMMLSEYSTLNDLIRVTNFYINKAGA